MSKLNAIKALAYKFGDYLIPPNRSYKNVFSAGQNRIVLIIIAIGIVYITILIKIVLVTGFPNDNYIKKSNYAPKETITRAQIYDRNGILVADILKSKGLFVNPKMVKNAELLTSQLVDIFPDMDYQKVFKKVTRKARFVWIKRKLTPLQQQRVNSLGDVAIDFIDAGTRVYPQKNLLSHVLGFVDVDNKGIGGLEQAFDKKLSQGKEPIYLSIDSRVQYILRSEVARAIKLTKAVGGTGIVMDINNGEVLAMTSLPDFDPNHPMKSPNRFNRATSGVYELGSTFKIINSAVALDSGKITMRDVFDASKPIRISGFTINDYHAKKKKLSVPEIFAFSSNIGSIQMIKVAGIDAQKKMMEKLNLLEPLTMDLPERARTLYPKHWRKIASYTIAYGHGIAVSPLHLISSIAALSNGGTFYNPKFIRDGISEGREVVSKQTSHNIRKLLRLNSTHGSGKNADVKRYLVGGKTGTADKVKKTGGYDKKSLISSYIAVFPMNKPEYAVYVVIDTPQPTAFTHFLRPTGGWAAAPSVGNIIGRIAPLLNVKPVDLKDPKIIKNMKIPAPNKYIYKDKTL